MTHRNVRGVLAGRGFMLFPAAAFVVHELRYRLAYGSHAGRALTQQGHGYLNSLAPWVVLLAAFAAGSFLARAARALAVSDGPGPPLLRPSRPFASLWLLSFTGLTGIYALQEWLEGVFAAGHPGGLAGVFGHGGWWAIVLAAAAGFVVACLLRLASEVVQALSGHGARRPFALAPVRLRRPSEQLFRLSARPAGSIPGRGPPPRRSAVAA